MKKRIIQSIIVLIVFCAVVYAVFGQQLFGGEDYISAGNGTVLKAIFINVGQGDSELIILPDGKTMLIDAGSASESDTVIECLNANKIEKIDYLIGTHPHEDHLGGMEDVIRSFDIGYFYMPLLAEDDTPTTRYYESLLDCVIEKNIQITPVTAGVVISESGGVRIECLAPLDESYAEINNYSAVIKLTYNSASFLFTGDAEGVSEKELLKSGADLSADVLKCGHHGSDSSTGENFLKAVSPHFAIISCGKNNQYGHPHASTLTSLDKLDVTVLRTDLSGTVMFESDGNHITFSTAR